MRWKSNVRVIPDDHSTREVKKFLLFPRRFDEAYWRWLEYAIILERYTPSDYGTVYDWREVAFVNE